MDGLTYVDDGLIEINAALLNRPAHLRRTLMHECIHVVVVMSGQKSTLALDEDKEEGLVEAMEHGLFPIMKHFVK